MLRTIGLIRFLKGDHDNNVPGCANYDHRYGGCLLGSECKVEAGKRCRYFEKAVLPAAVGLGIGAMVNDAYASKVGLTSFCSKSVKDVRRCSCGDVLKPRQRYCDKCSRERRRQAYRESQRKTRLSKRLSVNS